jgi:hypothetical protein
VLKMPVSTCKSSARASGTGLNYAVGLPKQTMTIAIVRASDTGPRHIIITGMVNPMDMWRFRSSVYQLVSTW